MISACNIRNFTIFFHKLPDGEHYLFLYFEYVGTDLDGDMKKIAADPRTQEWWQLTDPCQKPLPDRAPGEWWADMRRGMSQSLSLDRSRLNERRRTARRGS